MVTITASDHGHLDRAQGYFPKHAETLLREQAASATRLSKDAAHAELKRLNEPARELSEPLADASKRWQGTRDQARG